MCRQRRMPAEGDKRRRCDQEVAPAPERVGQLRLVVVSERAVDDGDERLARPQRGQDGAGTCKRMVGLTVSPRSTVRSAGEDGRRDAPAWEMTRSTPG